MKKDFEIFYSETDYGFKYGSAEVTRLLSYKKTGSVLIELSTPQKNVQVYITRTGKIRFFDPRGGEYKLSK